MVSHDVCCFGCGYQDVWMIDGSDKWRGECPECGSQEVRRVFYKAPSLGRSGDEAIGALQKDCREKFYKQGIDEVRHKHGAVADEAIRAADIKRIKKRIAGSV